MNSSVDFETAKILDMVGITKPYMAYHGMRWFDNSGEIWQPGSLRLNPDVCGYTALQIIEQMPPGTRILFDLSVWEVWFPVAQMQEDFRYDTCPHKAAALAFIAWKKGLET